ncbi:Uncharacterised protein [Staphylococcus gallinarum]|uniref:Uncharacterized protein n=1 Tax=Staphylococcus gallinarum TaxID=1293 RepID=A0A380FLQ8_STAGA|nr:Uncharacterised protein [Staphylococcus gallinarum]
MVKINDPEHQLETAKDIFINAIGEDDGLIWH